MCLVQENNMEEYLWYIMSNREKKYHSALPLLHDLSSRGKKSSQMKDQKKMCLWLVGSAGIFFLLLCTSKCSAFSTLKPSPKDSTKMEFEEVTLCQKYSQLSHLFEQCDASIPFKYWIPSFLLHLVGVGRQSGSSMETSQCWIGLWSSGLFTLPGWAWIAAFLDTLCWQVFRPGLPPKLPFPCPFWQSHEETPGKVAPCPGDEGTGSIDKQSRTQHPRIWIHRPCTSWMFRHRQ